MEPVLKYCREKKEWRLFTTYERRQEPKDAGFYWDPELRCWVTPKRERASRLIQYADPQTKYQLLQPRLQHLSRKLQIQRTMETIWGSANRVHPSTDYDPFVPSQPSLPLPVNPDLPGIDRLTEQYAEELQHGKQVAISLFGE
jgi:hypothetical protein